jgi:8-oxo-dGTP diphosphatase
MPWITRVYAYTHATVRLHFWRVTRWDGEPQRLEDQDIKWQRVEAPDVSPMLPANAPVLAALALPAVMIVSDASRMGIDAWIGALAKRALDEKMLVQVREKSMDKQKLQHVLSRCTGARGAVRLAMRGEQRLRRAPAVRRRAPHVAGA